MFKTKSDRKQSGDVAIHEINAVRMDDIQSKLDEQQRTVAELQVELATLQSRFNATVMFFEQRIDLIYRRVSVELASILGMGKIDSVRNIEAEMVLASYFNKAFDGKFEIPGSLRDIVLPEIKPGVIDGPLTLRGFRINRRRGREWGDKIEMFGNEDGIVVYGPYKSLRPGLYELIAFVECDLAIQSKSSTNSFFSLDVFSSDRGLVVAQVDAPVGERPEALEIRLLFDWAGGGTEFRVHNNSGRKAFLTKFVLKKTVAD